MRRTHRKDTEDNLQGRGANKTKPTNKTTSAMQHIILFYRYHPLSSESDVTDKYRLLLVQLCESLHLTGRLLVGCSKTEGINGTLAGEEKNVRAFTKALLPDDQITDDILPPSVIEFRTKAILFFQSIGEDVLLMQSPDDFKWSTSSTTVFPDLHTRLVAELIGTGGALSDISIPETSVGYLTPAEWHERMKSQNDDDTIVVDCRNIKEHQIGHFRNAVDPQTTTFEQFPKWVRDNEYQLAGKNVMMYCTGGIRCEKASAYVRKAVPSVKNVSHLKGGIHKYLEEFDTGEHWLGKNFVFDGRWAMPSQTEVVVGRCLVCKGSYDQFDPHTVCTVCREPTLVCDSCRENLVEYHCSQHLYLKHCYFSNLERFDVAALRKQLDDLQIELQGVSVGRRFKQKRKSLAKQMDRVRSRIKELGDTEGQLLDKTQSPCPNCGLKIGCPGRCWGFNGKQSAPSPAVVTRAKPATNPRPKQVSKRPRRSVAEFAAVSSLPSQYRDPTTGIRVPPCCIRTLECHIKAKWCSKPVLQVIQEQFFVGQPKALQEALKYGVLKLNGVSLTTEMTRTRLKTSDSLSRLVHWHEAPIVVPARLDIQIVSLPASATGSDEQDDNTVYVCNKPSTVPVHPAGPYLSNSLTLMAAAQLGLSSIQPLHRIDRATSGLTMLCNSATVARKFQQRLTDPSSVRKLYLAQVSGEFPTSHVEATATFPTACSDAKWEWSTIGSHVSVDAPIYTLDPAAGIRVVDASKGKTASSRFRSISFDGSTSLLACWLISGRNHQLRVHLQWLGYPIVGDVLYGGDSTAATLLDDAVLEMMGRDTTEVTTNPDEVSARKACHCCNEGVTKSFTDAQLLRAGHEIRLHALQYSVSLDEETQLEFRVSPPSWGEGVDETLLQNISWND